MPIISAFATNGCFLHSTITEFIHRDTSQQLVSNVFSSISLQLHTKLLTARAYDYLGNGETGIYKTRLRLALVTKSRSIRTPRKRMYGRWGAHTTSKSPKLIDLEIWLRLDESGQRNLRLWATKYLRPQIQAVRAARYCCDCWIECAKPSQISERKDGFFAKDTQER